MGRAAKHREQRAMQRLVRGARKLEAQQAKKPCDTCAFVDHEAFVADTEMAHKILKCLTEPSYRFFCHHGLFTQTRLDGTAGAYIAPRRPDGQIDTRQLTPCGGFLRWALPWREKSYVEQFQAVMALQRHMLARFFQSDQPFAVRLKESCGGRVDIAQRVLNEMSEGLTSEE